MDLRKLAAWASPWTLAACVACDEPLPFGTAGFCRVCADAVEPLHAQVDTLGAKGPWLIAGLRYGGPVADVIASVKFRGAPPNIGPLTAGWLETCDEVARNDSLDAWVAVPPQRERLRARGWHLPDLLAGTLAAATGRPALPLLDRVDNHAPRASGGHALPVFSMRSRRQAASLRVGLVDDVLTTGATARVAIAALERGGVTVGCVAVLADARSRIARDETKNAG